MANKKRSVEAELMAARSIEEFKASEVYQRAIDDIRHFSKEVPEAFVALVIESCFLKGCEIATRNVISELKSINKKRNE